MSKKPSLKTATQIDNIRHAGKILNQLLIRTAHAAKPGVSLISLEEQADIFLKEQGVVGAFKGYNGFPANLCLSVNDCVVHGIPDETVLKTGDLLKIDIGVTYQGGIADAAVSIIIGGKKNNPDGTHLITTTKKALDAGVETIQPGTHCFAFAQTTQKTMLQGNCAIIKNLTGHGVGNDVHEPPHLYNWPHESMKQLFRTPGRVVALEPITAIRSTDFRHGSTNERNLYTKKGDLGAQWEYTIAIHEDHVEILAGIEDPSVLYQQD